MLSNVFLLFMSGSVIFLWLMVNQVRQDIRDKRNADRDAQDANLELIAIEMISV